MLNILTNSNNYSFFDNNLLSYVLILCSLSVVGFSLYYYFNINSASDSVNTTSSNENLGQISNTDKKEYVDAAAQTDDTKLIDFLNEKLIENMSTNDSHATPYSPDVFIREYNENPHFTNYIDNIVNWSNLVSESSNTRQVFRNGMFPTTNSEHQYANMVKTIRDIKRTVSGNNPYLDNCRDFFMDCSTSNMTNYRLRVQLLELVNTKISYTIDQVNNIYASLCMPLTDDNVHHIADIIIRSANTFS